MPTTRRRRCAATRDRRSCRRSGRPASTRPRIDVVAMSHLHFDHAGGLLAADGSRAFPRARIVAQRAEWEIALSDNSAGRGVATSSPSSSSSGTGVPRAGRTASASSCRASRSSRPAATRPATRRSSSAARRRSADRRLLRRPRDAPVERQPALGHRLRRLPARLGRGQGAAVRRGRRRAAGSSPSRTSVDHPVGRLLRDRDRFRYEPSERALTRLLEPPSLRQSASSTARSRRRPSGEVGCSTTSSGWSSARPSPGSRS